MTRARFAGVVLLLASHRRSPTCRRGRGAPSSGTRSPLRVYSAVLVVCAAVLAAPAPARASEVTSAELRALAAEAADDRAALAELQRVDAVDGQPVDIAAALDGARGADLQARLRQLAEAADAVGRGRDASADARAVLAEERFREDRVPGPFRRMLDWIGDRLPSFDVDWLDSLLPGGRSVVWIALAALLVIAATVLARLFLARRVGAATASSRLQAAARDEDPRSLERRADAAEAEGDLEAALRLRFRAGLLRLDARGAIVFRPSISTSEVRRRLSSSDFDALAAAFDDIVYGGREAASVDVEAARERWPRVVERL